MTACWYVLKVVSGREKTVLRTLKEKAALVGLSSFVEELIVPVETLSEMRKGKPYIVERPIWHGYVYAKLELTDEVWQFIKDQNSVIDFICDGEGKPQPLSDTEVDAVLAVVADKQDKISLRQDLHPGQAVRITQGVFEGFTGKITKVYTEKGKVDVNLVIFGRDTIVNDLDYTCLEIVQENE